MCQIAEEADGYQQDKESCRREPDNLQHAPKSCFLLECVVESTTSIVVLGYNLLLQLNM